MFNDNSISIILPAFNEGKTISKFIKDLKKLNIFDEIIAVDNCSTDNTEEKIKENSGIKYIFEKEKGFGAAVKAGLNNSTAKIVFICEPDGSFDAHDCLKMIKLSNHYDTIFTSRSNKINRTYLKFGNIIYAKMISFLFKTPSLSDVGSSLRLLKKKDLDKFIKKLKSNGPELQMEITLNILKLNISMIEIPVNYSQRIGKSNYTGNFLSSLNVALRFTKIVIKKYFNLI